MKKVKIIRKSRSSMKLDKIALLVMIPISILVFLLNVFNKSPDQKNEAQNDINIETKVKSKICDRIKNLTFTDNNTLSITPDIINNEHICYDFYAKAGQKLYLQSSANVNLIKPSQSSEYLKLSDENGKELVLQETGSYSISILDKDLKNGQITISLQPNISSTTSLYSSPLPSINQPDHMRLITAYDYNQNNSPIYSQLTYQPDRIPDLQENQKLQQIVDDIVVFFQSKGLPTNRLSVSLIDLKTSPYPSYARYLDKKPRFPASVVKLFWMVYLYGQYDSRLLAPGTIPEKQLKKMIQDSDNEAASLILDTITRTESGENLKEYELPAWIQKRLAMNLFFQQAGYNNLNISQKVFPTKKFIEPLGRDLQIRLDSSYPIRDYVTTYDVARLLFEIEQEKAISRKYSKEMKALLKRSLHPEAWKNKDFNAIEGFLGEGLPRNAYFASKMGWNFNTRNDAAIIGSPNGKHKYILVIFGDDPSFYKDKKLLPELSRMVYEQMTN